MALRRTCHHFLAWALCEEAAPALHFTSLRHFSSKSDFDADDRPPRTKKTKPPSKKKPEEKLARKPSSTDSDPDSFLIKALKKQFIEATDLANKYQTEVRGSFKPFEVVSNEAGSDLTLRRVIGKEEVVVVKCILDLENPHVEGHSHSEDGSSESDDHDSDDDELRITQHVTMNVQISKGPSQEDQPKMAFLCSYTKGEAIFIEDVAYLRKSVHEDYPYSGPYFPDLDNNLKQVFQNVIKARGINSSLADTITEHLTNQYQNGYLDWLKKIREFLVR